MDAVRWFHNKDGKAFFNMMHPDDLTEDIKPTERQLFEAFMSDDGAYPQAVERRGEGYKLLQADASWSRVFPGACVPLRMPLALFQVSWR